MMQFKNFQPIMGCESLYHALSVNSKLKRSQSIFAEDTIYLYFGVFLMKQLFHPRFLDMNKGGKFLKKLWCCIGGRV